MTREEAIDAGYTLPVMLSLHGGQYWYRELNSKSPEQPETPGLRDKNGSCVYQSGDEYFDLPQRAEELLLD